jgi:hypothetical protein
MSVVERAPSAPPASAPLHRRLPGGRTLRDGRRLYWWGELLAVLIFYGIYSFVRNLHHGGKVEAYQNALDIIDLQEALGINHEQAIQAWAQGWHAVIVAANYFYGSLHFIVTAGVMIYLYRRWSNDYPLWRNTLGVATGLALIGFAFFPLMPPRLLPASFGFVDTLAQDPAFWSFNSGAVNKISNQYAAMPSVHCAWALWCTCALVPRVRHSWAKALAVLYPVTTVTVIVVTANHYVIDAVGGFIVLGVGYVAARTFTRAGRGEAVGSVVRTTGEMAAHQEADREPDRSRDQDHQDHRRGPGVEEPVDTDLVGVEQAEQQQHSGQ